MWLQYACLSPSSFSLKPRRCIDPAGCAQGNLSGTGYRLQSRCNAEEFEGAALRMRGCGNHQERAAGGLNLAASESG